MGYLPGRIPKDRDMTSPVNITVDTGNRNPLWQESFIAPKGENEKGLQEVQEDKGEDWSLSEANASLSQGIVESKSSVLDKLKNAGPLSV